MEPTAAHGVQPTRLDHVDALDAGGAVPEEALAVLGAGLGCG
jgi:hypothetical protein